MFENTNTVIDSYETTQPNQWENLSYTTNAIDLLCIKKELNEEYKIKRAEYNLLEEEMEKQSIIKENKINEEIGYYQKELDKLNETEELPTLTKDVLRNLLQTKIDSYKWITEDGETYYDN
jgi:hypothetical protein